MLKNRKTYQNNRIEKLLSSIKDKIIETELFIINALLFVIIYKFLKNKNNNTKSNKDTNSNKDTDSNTNTNNNINTITINIIKYPY